MVGLNVGCGTSPTPGYFNYDNSYSVRLSRISWALRVLARCGLASRGQVDFATVARLKGIRWANAHHLPHADKTVDIVYSSHMVEHLDQRDVQAFLAEVKRVLKPAGIIRLVLPDLRMRAESYLLNGNANEFVAGLYLAREQRSDLLARVRWLIVGDRRHAWMYDARSAVELLLEAGFESPVSLQPGETTIADPGLLDLCQRDRESIYVEARSPQRGSRFSS